ncbi:MAG: protein kinase [Lachnospiraceae bacterium]|jgi:serine/threonine protein kinase|nr:protein kinase [Lachnospiraceae bacterium]
MGIERLDQVWPEWRSEALLGEGSFGKVYRAVREEHGVTAYSAIKVLSIPQNDAELSSLRSEGYSDGAMKTYFQGIVDDFANEIKLMQSMKGNSNIVSVEDFKVLEKTDKVGWDVYIRMELLTSFNDHISDRKLTEAEVIKIGEDILSALELCAHRKVIHRDIKPENIFVSPFGFFKLGDFGIARELEKTSGSMSQKGTYSYIAPEVAHGRHYDATVDIYSLGLILYRLLNNNRLPFLDPEAELVQYQDRKDAVDKRLGGAPLPAPAEASHSMAQVILRACAYNPADRYQTPTEFREALETVKAGGSVPDFERTELLDESGTVQIQNKAAPPQAGGKPAQEKPGRPRKGKGRKLIAIGVMAAIIAALAVGGYFFLVNRIAANKADSVIAALENQDYSAALAAFNNRMDERSLAVLESQLSRRLEALRSDYTDEKTEYNAAIMELDTIKRFAISGLSGIISEIEQYVVSLNDSRVAFSLAQARHGAGDYLGAIAQYKRVLLEDKNYNQALEGLTNAVADYKRHALEEAEALAGSKNYASAMGLLDIAMEAVGNDAELARQRDAYEKQGIGDRIEGAKGLANAGDYAAANIELRALQSEYPDSNEIRLAIADVETANVAAITAQATKMTGAGDYAGALTVLNDGLGLYPNNNSLKTALGSTQDDYAAQSIEQADGLLAEGGFEEAVALLNETAAALPGHQAIAAKLQAIEDSRPKSLLAALPPYETNRCTQYTQPALESFQMGGVEYGEGLVIESYNANADYEGNGYALFNLGGKYAGLEFVVGHIDGTNMNNAVVNIYLDGELAQSVTVNANALPKKVAIPLEQAAQLRIICLNSSESWGWTNYGFADLVIW